MEPLMNADEPDSELPTGNYFLSTDYADLRRFQTKNQQPVPPRIPRIPRIRRICLWCHWRHSLFQGKVLRLGRNVYDRDSSEKSRSIWDQQAMPRSWGTIISTCDSDGFSVPYSLRRCLRQAGLPGSRRRHSSGRWS